MLRALAVESSESNGYCFQIEMAHRAWQEGFRVLEALVRVTGWALTGGRNRFRVHHELSVVRG